MEDFIWESDEPQDTRFDAKDMLRDTLKDRAACDAMLSKHARHWDLTRLAMVDRNILRLSVQELRVGKTPFKVVISEALRLAQEFSTAESPRFINGVLDAIMRELQKELGNEPPERPAKDAPQE